MSHSELAQFSEYLTTNIPRRKNQLTYFALTLTLPWQFTFSSTDFTFFIHLQSVMMGENWREGIFPLEAFNLESSIISRTKGWGGKGRQSKGNLAAGAENGQHQSTHIDSKYCLYLNSTLTPTFIQIWLYVPFYIFHLIKTKIHYKWKGNRKHIPSCSIKPRPFLCLVKFTLEYSRTEPFVQKLKCKVVF